MNENFYKLVRLYEEISGELAGGKGKVSAHKKCLGADLAQQPERLEQLYLPLCFELARRRLRGKETPLIVGITGAQGTGKSTFSRSLGYLLQSGLGLRVQTLSLDDFYLGKHARKRLAEEVHPLFATRGVPGTHDIARLDEVLHYALSGERGRLALPVFDKGLDDRSTEDSFEDFPVDCLLLEGWCIGVRAQAEADLMTPLNALERDEDAEGIWRRAVNAALGGAYAKVFAKIDYLVHLRPPDFETVYTQRSAQEATLPAEQQMSEAALHRFISHYERLTRHSLRTTETGGRGLTREADLMIDLRSDWSIESLTFRPMLMKM